jgi:formylglycine-generating enzyme required for sulfatase activity
MKTNLIALLLLFAVNVSGQEKQKIIGFILDDKTKLPLSNVSIEVKSRDWEMISSLDGSFEIFVPPLTTVDTLQISHVGYKTVKKKIGDLKQNETIFLKDFSIELRSVTVNSRKFSLKEIDDGLRIIRGNLYAYETETTNGLYNLFLSYLEEQGQPELLKQCSYDLSSYSEKDKALYNEYVSPFRKPLDKKDTTVKNYTNFPAVNISHDAAVIFCQWLTEQYNSSSGKKKFSKVKFRLPTLKEWQIAALGCSKFQSWDLKENLLDVIVPDDTTATLTKKGVKKTIRVGDDVLYPWWGAYYYRRKAQNHMGCFLGNFKVVNPVNPCSYTRPGFDGWTKMAITASYYPNNIGLYDVVGNVAEMIDEDGKACGGSWNDSPEESTLHSVKSYRKPNSTVGFRIFMEVVEK